MKSIPRRRFLCQITGGVSAFHILGCARSVWTAQANDKLNIALIGVGGRGEWFTGVIPRLGHNLVALCDVDDAKNPDAYERLPQARRFHDFRRMFDGMHKSIDGVIVAAPDHTHAVASAAAIRAGKPVFCEKPLTRTLHESRALRDLARQHKVATSMGNQGTAAGPFRRALELLRADYIGEVKEVHVWNDSGGADRRETPPRSEPVPEDLHWDLWLGPAAFRPFHRDWLKRHLWREFGTNQLGNWGSHTANLAFMALQVQDLWLKPEGETHLRVQARHSGINRLSFPKWEVVTWSIPARGNLGPIDFTWHNGRAPGSRERIEALIDDELDWGDKKEKKWADFAGAVLVGTKGSIHTTGHNATFRLLPAEKFAGVQRDRPEQVEASPGHEQEWLNACRGQGVPWANFDYADALNEFLMLGNVATQFEVPLQFDPVSMRVLNEPAADALLRSEYREGWTL